MTLPLLLALHLVYGVAMAFAMERRMRSEGEVLGLPLVLAMTPVAVVSTPLSAVLARWSAGWFFHGFFLGEGSVSYERFHLGIMMGIGVVEGLVAAAALVFTIAFLSRDARRLALAPVGLAALIALLVALLDGKDAFVITGTGGATVLTHPAGIVSAAIVLGLVAAWFLARARLSAPIEVR